MRTIRLPVTGLENRRYYLHPPPWIDDPKTDLDYVDELVGRIETPAMRLGTAFEDALVGKPPTPGFTFTGDIRWNRPAALQVPVRYEVPLPDLGVRVVLSGRLDGIDGDVVVDVKATAKPFNLDKYHDSWQWRVYLLASGYRRFRYDVFRLLESRRTPGEFWVADQTDFECQAYPEMASEVAAGTAEWVEALLGLEAKGLVRLSAERGGVKPGPAYRTPDERAVVAVVEAADPGFRKALEAAAGATP